MSETPAVLFLTFNRLDCAVKALAAIAQAKPSRLYVASDGPRPGKKGEKESVERVREYIMAHVDWPCEVHTRFLESNSGGCKFGVSGAISWFFEHEREGVIIEDDVVADPSFFRFCRELLDRYRDDKRVWSICGEGPVDADITESYYFARTSLSWGWATWADRWSCFSTDFPDYRGDVIEKFSAEEHVRRAWQSIRDKIARGEMDTWAYIWAFLIVANDGLCAMASHCLTSNIGNTGVHYHNSRSSQLNRRLVGVKTIVHPAGVSVNEALQTRIYDERYMMPIVTQSRKIFKIAEIPVLSVDVLRKEVRRMEVSVKCIVRLFDAIPVFKWRDKRSLKGKSHVC